MNKELIYDIHDRPRTTKELFFYATQQLASVFVATVLIARICGTPVSSCLFGAGVGTIIYQLITGFNSPMFISSCGATCSAVIGALALGSGGNYAAVVAGGVVIFAVYAIFSLLIKLMGEDVIVKLFSPLVTGAVTMVIGLNLAKFIPTYVQVADGSNYGMIVALIAMFVTAIAGHYFKGFFKTVPLLVGLAAGYAVSVIFTLCGVCKLIDFSVFDIDSVFAVPQFTMLEGWMIKSGDILKIVAMFLPVSLCAMLEHYSDHRALSNIIGTDLIKEPGLHRTLLADGTASLAGTLLCGLPNTSYGESIAATGFSRVASVRVITTAATGMIVMSFFTPFQALLASIPQPVFGGLSMILYGYITCSGLKMILSCGDDLRSNRSLVLVGAVLSVGVSGVFMFSESFGGVSLAMVVGVILNLILKNKEGT